MLQLIRDISRVIAIGPMQRDIRHMGTNMAAPWANTSFLEPPPPSLSPRRRNIPFALLQTSPHLSGRFVPLGIHRLLLLGFLESLARLFQLFSDFVGRGEFLSFRLLSIFFSKEVIQIGHCDATKSGLHEGRPTRTSTCVTRDECEEEQRTKNTPVHGLIGASAEIVHMGLSPPEVSSANAWVKRATKLV